MDTESQEKYTVDLIDWLSVTYLPEVWAEQHPTMQSIPDIGTLLNAVTGDKSKFVRSKARYGYSAGWRSMNGTIAYAHVVGSGEQERVGDLGVHIVHTGGSLNHIEDHFSLLSTHVLRGAKITRIDIARDTFGFDLDLQAMKRELQSDGAKTRARTFHMWDGSTGETLYVGSRDSAQFLRVYDKGIQTGENEPGYWYRAELEVKGKRANRVAKFILECGGFDASEMITAFYNTNIAEWESAMAHDATYGSLPSEKTVPNTRAWLLGQVAKIVAKQSLNDRDFLDAFDTSVAEWKEIIKQDMIFNT